MYNTKKVQVIWYEFLRKQYPNHTYISILFLRNKKYPRDEYFLNCRQLKKRTGSWKKGLADERKNWVVQLPQPAANLCDNQLSCNQLIKAWGLPVCSPRFRWSKIAHKKYIPIIWKSPILKTLYHEMAYVPEEDLEHNPHHCKRIVSKACVTVS